MRVGPGPPRFVVRETVLWTSDQGRTASDRFSLPLPSQIEVPAVRIYLVVLLVGVLLAPVLGCKSSDKLRNGALTRSGGTNKDNIFTGAPSSGNGSGTAGESTNLASGGTTNRRSGVLAGRILDGDARLRPNARIQIIDIEASESGIATLSAAANAEGYFDISGLEPGKPYRLVAKVQDGRKVLVGSARVIPPNPRVAIYLNDEMPVAEGGLPASGGVPAVAPPGTGGPTASIGAPIRGAGEGVTTPLGGEGTPPAVNTTDPSHIAVERDNKSGGGFTPDTTPPTVNILGPGRANREKPSVPGSNSLPPPPITDEIPPSDTPAVAVPRNSIEIPRNSVSGETVPAPRSTPLRRNGEFPVTPTVVPSCLLTGTRLENFALYDTQGRTFELKNLRKPRRLILVDFWYTACPPCRAAIAQLNDLHTRYNRSGLDIVGVTCEPGSSLSEQRASLQSGMAKFRLNPRYPLVFSQGENCPVRRQLLVYSYPTLILLDDSGKILFRCEGLDKENKQTLVELIDYRLNSGKTTRQ